MSMANLRGLKRPHLAQVLFWTFLLFLLLAGGASREDAVGQIVIRSCAFGLLIAHIILGQQSSIKSVWQPWLIVSCSIILPLCQMVIPMTHPVLLPYDHLSNLEGATSKVWSLVPGATLNAAISMTVPLAMLALMTSLPEDGKRGTVSALIVLVGISVLWGLIQFSGVVISNGLINDTPGQVSGNFANRNHFALFIAIGCVLLPSWAFDTKRPSASRMPLAVGLMLVFILTIMATGSRSGLLLCGIAILVGIGLAWGRLRAAMAGGPRWLFPGLMIGLALVVSLVIGLSIAADRANSIQRIVAVDTGQDMRSRGLPTVLYLIGQYWPLGDGFGGFDQVFRMHEPDGLLKPTYFNHAHNDFLEIILDGGIFGGLLLVGALLWWAYASAMVFWRGAGAAGVRGRLGSAIILLVLIASVFDYPARTPMIMALLAVAAVWLAEGARGRLSALPAMREHL